MGEGEEKMVKAPSLLLSQHNNKHEDEWLMVMDNHDDDIYDTSSLDYNSSNGSIYSSSDVADDDASSPTSSASNSNGPLFELTELMTHLPIKRGLSKYYQGKSQSFTSLSRVISIEDLPKKETPYRRKIIKASKSYENGLDAYKAYTLPKPIISKKVSRSCLSSPSFPVRKGGIFLNSSRPPPAPPVQNKF